MRKIKPAMQPKEQLNALCGRRLTSLGDYERLAGIDTCSVAERQDLWAKFRHLNAASVAGDHQPLFDAVANHCAAVALQRIARGELCLVTGAF